MRGRVAGVACPKGSPRQGGHGLRRTYNQKCPFLRSFHSLHVENYQIRLTLIFLFIIEGIIEEILKISLELCVEGWQRIKKEQVWGMDQSAWCTQRREG